MQITPKFSGVVEKGKLIINHQDKYNNYLRGLIGRVEVVIRKWRTTRSQQQNRYYWGVVLDIIESETGNVAEDLHEFFRKECLKKWIVVNKKEIEIVKSTTELTTKEFEEYLEKIRMWAAEENIYIPLPNEVDI